MASKIGKPKQAIVRKRGEKYIAFFLKGVFTVPIHKRGTVKVGGAKAAKEYANWQKQVNGIPVTIVKTEKYHAVYIGSEFSSKQKAENYISKLIGV